MPFKHKPMDPTPYLTEKDELRLFFWNTRNNFGDQLSKEIIEWVTGRKVKLVDIKEKSKLVSLGSILHSVNDNDLVWGTGVHPKYFLNKTYYGKNPLVFAVRGPITRDFLMSDGINCPKIYGDPGIFMPLIYNPKIKKNKKFGIIPHYSEKELFNQKEIIDVEKPWKEVINEILKCEKIVSTSLHGIIIAEAYGIPAIWLRISKKEGTFKFFDYYLGTGRMPSPAYSLKEAVEREKIELPQFNHLNLFESFPKELIANEEHYQNRLKEIMLFQKNEEIIFPKKLNLNLEKNNFIKTHRSGWEYAINSLKPVHNEKGFLLEGFIDKKFRYGRDEGDVRNNPSPIREPWIGFIHTPHNTPKHIYPERALEKTFESEIWKESIKYCKGIFCLSKYQKEALEKILNVPIEDLIHPTETPEIKFNMKSFLTNNDKKIIQIGLTLRKVNSIFLLKTDHLKRKILSFDSNLLELSKQKEKEALNISPDYSSVEEIKFLENEEYDKLLSENIVFLDLWDVAACNTIIECIVRNTPILVNPLPAAKEYLGEDYPFYFNTLEEASEKAEDIFLIRKTHEYLKKHPIKEKLTGEYFLKSFVNSKIYKSL